MNNEDIRKLVPNFTTFQTQNGDRVDRAINKVQALKDIIASGSTELALKDGKIDTTTLSRYLKDSLFLEQLSKIEDFMASELTEIAYAKARNGDNDMLKFMLPALNERFDSGIRKAKALGNEKMKSDLFKKLLGSSPSETKTDASTDTDD